MAKKRKTEESPMTQAAPTGRTEDRHTTHRLPVHLPVEHHRQLKKLAARQKRPLRWQLLLIVEEALKAEGLWPPTEEETESH
jgi:hypothetical protein